MPRERIYDYPDTEYAKAIARLGLNQVEAAKMLGINDRTSRRYAAGDLELPRPLQMLLRVLVALERSREWIEKVTSKPVS